MKSGFEKLRVMHLVNRAFPDESGYSIRGKSIFESQKRAGLEPIVVVSPYFHHDSVGHASAAKSWQNDWARSEGIDYYYYQSRKSSFGALSEALVNLRKWGFRGNRFLAVKVDEVARNRYIQGAFNVIEPDLIHAHTGVGYYGRRLSRRTKCPWVYEMRGFWEDSFAAEGAYSEGSKAYKRAQFQDTELAMAADAVVVISEAMRRDLMVRGIPGEKIRVVPNSVEVSRFVPINTKDPELVERLDLNGKVVAGYITNIRRLEGLETLVRSIPKIVEKFPYFCVVIVGDGSHKSELERLVSRLGLESYVRFTGRMPHDEIERFYSIIDIFVIPRINRRVNRLVTPLKVLEAMAMERALLVSNVDALTEIVQDGRTGLVFEADNPGSLARQCIELCSDAGRRESLGKEARIWVTKERSPGAMAKEYGLLYEKVLEQERKREGASGCVH